MKKNTISIFLIIGLCVVAVFAAIKSQDQWNAEVPNQAIVISGNDVTFADAVTVNGSLGATDVSGTLTQDGDFIQEPATVVNVDTATTVSACESFILVVGSNTSGGFAVTNTANFLSTTTANAVDGQIVEIMGTSNTNTVTLTDSTSLEMDGGTVVLGLGSSVRFRFYNDVWYMADQQVNTID